MAMALPSRLLCYENGEFSVVNSKAAGVPFFDIISYTWGDSIQPYNCDIPGVTWRITIRPEKLNDIKQLMKNVETKYLWCDCVCINQEDQAEKAVEIAKMFEYFKTARTCHIMLDIPRIWNPQGIVDSLKFLDHVLANMGGASLATEARLTPNLIGRLSQWANEFPWMFPMEKSTVRSAGVDLGVVNCYATCIHHVRSLFDNVYFSRVWTFQEMILGKNISLWAVNAGHIEYIGELDTWMDLATDSTDKAHKLFGWIDNSRVVYTASVNAISRIIVDDKDDLESLQLQVRGISGARADIVNGGPNWWQQNYRGIENIFSAISLKPRQCKEKADIFRGLLGIFANLFNPEQVQTDMVGDDLDRISFNFFRQLSIRTGLAWTKLAISSRERGEWDWIPVLENYNGVMTTDCFSGVINLGRLKPRGHAKTMAHINVRGTPRTFMRMRLTQQEGVFSFYLRGCNCGKSVKTGTFSREPIPVNEGTRVVAKDETGRILVECSTMLGAILDPGHDIVDYRRKLLRRFQPHWTVSDPIAKPANWIDRSVSGTAWENPDQRYLRTHNQSFDYRMIDIDIAACGSRLANESTARIACQIEINCGCVIRAPFPFLFEALSAVHGSFLGDVSARVDNDGRIVLKDGVGLVQVGDIGKTFNLIAFSGDANAHRSYASNCRNTKVDRMVVPDAPWPFARALVREEFTHGITDSLRDYGYVPTNGSGNLLICKKNPIDDYRILGVCIDEYIEFGGAREVHIR